MKRSSSLSAVQQQINTLQAGLKVRGGGRGGASTGRGIGRTHVG